MINKMLGTYMSQMIINGLSSTPRLNRMIILFYQKQTDDDDESNYYEKNKKHPLINNQFIHSVNVYHVNEMISCHHNHMI
ncbi:hypothetical protein DERP_006834 [Dermatophagoides pteronyssinus]|uniref:Uncharacterized protein n=1 Tax=Dermatophagoides pteronyssinus TaxID=6956 RepID=A0ABQ8IS47_DERPT|nr:hypothetical protein DERP_006834 [Dermatophagoides pteronyssinus]